MGSVVLDLSTGLALACYGSVAEQRGYLAVAVDDTRSLHGDHLYKSVIDPIQVGMVCWKRLVKGGVGW